MRHRVAHRKLGRITEHRIAMLRNQASDLIKYGRIKTTVARGKELRPFVERLITIAKRSLTAEEGSIKHVNARRMVAIDIVDKAVVKTLFTDIAPRYADRKGGYTRLLRTGYRRGDSAEKAEIELLGSEFDPNAKTRDAAEGDAAEPKAKKTVGGRIRQALGGGRTKKADAAPKVKADKSAKGGKRVTTPRKAGGS
ncbi:MAG: 50S ribosomal protein L17 [Acidimicrobiia bacterium]|nr:50S ribosomal protein L17 [Acidimicrobiia bacterium]